MGLYPYNNVHLCKSSCLEGKTIRKQYLKRAIEDLSAQWKAFQSNQPIAAVSAYVPATVAPERTE